MKKQIITLITIATLIVGCNRGESLIDASGVFEATEIIVSAEGNGKILSFGINEGDVVTKDTLIGLIDTTDLYFSKSQLIANKNMVLSNLPNIATQIEATEQEIIKQKYEKQRLEKLLAGDVATQKQLDDITAQIGILEAHLNSQKGNLSNSTKSLIAQADAINVQIAQTNDQLKKCHIKSPITGTVLVKYAEMGELTARGKALFKIADMDNMYLKAYVTSSQLTQLNIGQEVKIFAEFGESENREYSGTITWISGKAEFTPKTIQTQDERANLVYAVNIAVKNDGYLKIGMYGGFKNITQ